MQPLPLALLLAAAIGVAVMLYRRSSDELARAVVPAAVLAVPIAAFAIVPILNGVEATGEASAACRIVSQTETRPADCQPDGLEPGEYTLLADAVRTPAGKPLPFGDQPEGFVDQTRVRRGRAQVLGWAGDRDSGRPASAVLIFVGGGYVGAVAPATRRPDIAELLGTDRALRSGFDVRLPRVAGKLVAVGLSDDRAHRLTFDCARPREFGC